MNKSTENNVFLLNPALSMDQLEDAIENRLCQLNALINVMYCEGFIDRDENTRLFYTSTLIHLLNGLECLHQALWTKLNNNH